MNFIRAAEMVTAADLVKANKLDREDGFDWADLDRFYRFRAVIESAKFWVVSEREIAGSVANTEDGRIWGYVASDILDKAADLMGVTDGMIHKDSERSFRLTW